MGTVYLLGAGPGDPELLTVKAARILSQASIVLYDSLVSAEILQLIPQTAERVDALAAPVKRSTPFDARTSRSKLSPGFPPHLAPLPPRRFRSRTAASLPTFSLQLFRARPKPLRCRTWASRRKPPWSFTCRARTTATSRTGLWNQASRRKRLVSRNPTPPAPTNKFTERPSPGCVLCPHCRRRRCFWLAASRVIPRPPPSRSHSYRKLLHSTCRHLEFLSRRRNT